MDESHQETINPLNTNPGDMPPESVAQVEQAPEEASPKKKRRGLMAALIVLFVAVVAGSVVAVLLILKPFGKPVDDKVPNAIMAMFGENAPTNIKMNGFVSVYDNNEGAVVDGLELTFENVMNTVSLVNAMNAKITVTFAGGIDLDFDADEVHTEDGDLYLKVKGIRNALEDYRKTGANELLQSATNCIDGESGTNCMQGAVSSSIQVLDVMNLADTIDDEWILIPSNSFSNLTDLTEVNATTQCLVDAIPTITKYASNISKSYTENPFITYTTDQLGITSHGGALYKLGVDTDKLLNFLNGMDNYGFVNELNACMGRKATNKAMTADELGDVIKMLPTVYAEVGENGLFSRVYAKASNLNGTVDAVADIDLSYPNNVTITEPEMYIDVNNFISQVLTQFYSGMMP